MIAAMTVVRTSRLLLRPLSADDLDAMAALRSRPEVARFIGGGEPQSRDEVAAMLARVERQWRERGVGRWGIVDAATSAFIGWCGFAPFAARYTPIDGATHPSVESDATRDDVELGFGLDPSVWGRGYAAEAARAALELGFTTCGFPRAYAVVHPENVHSRRVLERIGMQHVGRGTFRGMELLYYRVEPPAYPVTAP